jgi:signal transduction histidine kinase
MLLLRTAEELRSLGGSYLGDTTRTYASLLYVPLWLGVHVFGVLSVQSYALNAYTAEHVRILNRIGHQVAIAIQNAQLYEQAQQEIAERARAEVDVRRHRDHLEDLVEERVAEIKHINAELQQQNAELDAFAHTVAHDLKNPLGPLMGFAEILLEELRDTPDEVAQDCANHLLTASRKMARIIDELLLLASVRRQDEVRLEELDMAAIVHEVQERIDYLAREYDAEIHLPRVWPRAIGHAAWIEEVWTNYLSNAIKYGGRPPRIELGATVLEHTGMARFWVRDNGAGLKPEDQARLFTEFTQLHQLRAQGHGLGLSIVRRIIERLGGQVGVESAPDHGSAFFFTLPMA